MFSHITVGTSDLAKSTFFYDAMLAQLGFIKRSVTPDGGPLSSCWINPNSPLPRFYVYEPLDGAAMSAGNGSMTAFIAPSEEAVRKAFTAAIKKGGTSVGDPGPRPKYGKGYYGAYLLDPDGNKIHIVYRGDI